MHWRDMRDISTGQLAIYIHIYYNRDWFRLLNSFIIVCAGIKGDNWNLIALRWCNQLSFYCYWDIKLRCRLSSYMVPLSHSTYRTTTVVSTDRFICKQIYHCVFFEGLSDTNDDIVLSVACWEGKGRGMDRGKKANTRSKLAQRLCDAAVLCAHSLQREVGVR